MQADFFITVLDEFNDYFTRGSQARPLGGLGNIVVPEYGAKIG